MERKKEILEFIVVYLTGGRGVQGLSAGWDLGLEVAGFSLKSLVFEAECFSWCVSDSIWTTAGSPSAEWA